MSALGKKTLKGTFWAALDRFSNLGIQFVVNLILARLLAPDAFGLIGIIYIFIAVSQSLVDGGFGAALIQKKHPTQQDYSTILWFSTLVALVLYAIIFAVSPWVADFFHIEELTGVLRGLSIIIILTGPNAILNNRLRKQLEFRKIAVSNILGIFIGGVVSVIMAYHGCGAWSLVGMMVTNYLVQGMMLAIVSRWRPSLVISRRSIKELFGFGGYLLSAGLLQEFCKHMQGIIIGHKFSATQMGYYSQAQKFDQVTSYSIPQIITQVMYPVYSTLQDDEVRMRETIDMNVRIMSFLIFPVLSLLIILAPVLLPFLFGDQWIPAVPYYQILCVGGLFLCLQNINFYAVAAKGKSRALFIWSIYKWGFLLAAIFLGSYLGMYGILWGMTLSNFNIYLVNALLVSRYTTYNFGMQMVTMSKQLMTAGAAFAVAFYAARWLDLSEILQGVVFMAAFLIIAMAFRLRALGDIKGIIGMLGSKMKLHLCVKP